MVRLFKKHRKRKSYLLEGIWKLKTDPQKIGVHEKWFQDFPVDARDVVIPSCWNTQLGLFDYTGLAWYSAKFTTTQDHINLIFHGITGYSEVYLDGINIGNHYGGWTGFNIVLKNLNPGEHTLVISIDNTPNDHDTIPLSRVDWFHYGGIIRDVEIQELSD